MNQLPVVSICVPIYNAEKYLVPFLESAIFQTLENIEIICVDNHSTDNTKEIICAYVKKYPDKVFYYQTDRHYLSAGAGRNVAVQHSRGEYLFFCDGDDLISPYAMEKLYECAITNQSDLVCGWAYRLFMDTDNQVMFSKPMAHKKTSHATNEMAIQSGCEFWMRLIKKDLVISVGKIPEEYVFDDVAYVTVINSYAKNIMFLDFPVYNQFYRASSTSGRLRLEVCETSVLAEKYALEHCNPKYRNAVESYVAGRTKNNIEYRWPFFGLFSQWAKEQMQWLTDNPLVPVNCEIYRKIKWAAEVLGNQHIPSRVIVGGFSKTPSDERLEELSERVFYDDCQLIVLNEQNCDVNENPYIQRAYRDGEYEFVTKYFALKEIYENGGVFIDDCVRILNYFDIYTYQKAIFGLADKNTYIDTLFGAPPGQAVLKDILNTYSDEWDAEQIYPSLAERIKMILTAKYGIPMDGNRRLFQQEISILSPDLCIVDTRFGSNTKWVICEHDFSSHAGEEDYITIRRDTLGKILSDERRRVNNGVAQGQNSSIMAKAKAWDNLTHSHVYKFVLLWKKIGDSCLGPVLKKILNIALRIKRKIKK